MQRNTAQRRAIQAVFWSIERPLSPLEVLAAAQDELPGLGIATVYRSLKDLVEEQWLVVVELPGEAPRYERRTKASSSPFSLPKMRASVRSRGLRAFAEKACTSGVSPREPRSDSLWPMPSLRRKIVHRSDGFALLVRATKPNARRTRERFVA